MKPSGSHVPLPPVLYVEDEEDDVLFMQRAFSRGGVSNPLRIACDGKQGMEFLQEALDKRDTFALIILDLNLPLIPGLELLHWIRGQDAFRAVPVVIVSSSAQERDFARAKQYGADEYVVKPGNPSQLGEFVLQLQKRWLTADPD